MNNEEIWSLCDSHLANSLDTVSLDPITVPAFQVAAQFKIICHSVYR